MSYKYLDDGTKFNAEEINDRVESAAQSVNNVDTNSLAFGALRHEHLPQLIGPSGYDKGGFNKFTSRRGQHFDDANPDILGRTLETMNVKLNYDVPLSIVDDNINAFIILFNANIKEFRAETGPDSTRKLSAPTNERNEDFLAGFFSVAVDVEFRSRFTGSPDATYADSTRIDFGHSKRAVSPGFTFFGTTAPAGDVNRKRGSAFRTDEYSFRDIALRTILTKSDFIREIYGDSGEEELLDTIKIKTIYINCSAAYLSDSGPGTGPFPRVCLSITKQNLTVIPIQAEVLETGV